MATNYLAVPIGNVTSAAEPGADFLGGDDSCREVAADGQVSGVPSTVDQVERWNRLVERQKAQ